ncbi:MAG TPA: hypothetical protein PKU97_09580 [Kofleriaceae bacterium]|nr:hypothetical protein [Kofleriaceae bacterium]
MTALSVPQQGSGRLAALYWRLFALPWHAIKVYPPVLLIASSAAYASAQFAAQHGIFPFPFNVMQSVAFEWVYLGALALAGNRRGLWFYTTVGFGALTSALYMFLHAATQNSWLAQFAGDPLAQFLFALAHALPLTLVGVSYMLLIHVHLQDEQQKADADAKAAAARVTCRYCGAPCRNQAAEWSHYRTCPKHPRRTPRT